jgi:hypothetical protein
MNPDSGLKSCYGEMHDSVGPDRNKAPYPGPAPDELAFYVAANDRDVLGQINHLMASHGYVGVMDTAGRLHYLVDGRRGTPYASRRILEVTGRILCDRLEANQPMQQLICRSVDQVLNAHGIRPELKGYRYLRCMLLLIGLDDTKIKPISKKLHPSVAAHFHVRVSQIERDVRYALRETDLYRSGLTPTASICRLQRDLVRSVEEQQMLYLQQDSQPACPVEKEKPFRAMSSPEGPFDYVAAEK